MPFSPSSLRRPCLLQTDLAVCPDLAVLPQEMYNPVMSMNTCIPLHRSRKQDDEILDQQNPAFGAWE